MAKDTTKILEELQLCPDFRSFYSENQDHLISQSLSQLLEQLLAEKKLKKSQVISQAEMSEVYGYQIFSGLRVPDRKKLLALAVGMELNITQVQSLLKCAGYPPLYAKLPFDSIVLFGLCKNMSVVQINELLYEYDLETLG